MRLRTKIVETRDFGLLNVFFVFCLAKIIKEEIKNVRIIRGLLSLSIDKLPEIS